MADAAALLASLRDRAGTLARQLKHLHQGDVEALHRARVTSRRLRELLPIVGLDADTTQKLRRHLKKLTRRLGKVRDLDVLVEIVENLGRDRRFDKKALKVLEGSLERARAAARERLSEKLSSGKTHRLVRQLKRAAKHLERRDEESEPARRLRLARTAIWVLDARAARRARRLRQAMEAAGTVYAPDRLHELRVALKTLRYAVELRATAQHRRAGRDAAGLKTSQELLGRLHDYQLLIKYARDVQAESARSESATSVDLASFIRSLDFECRRLHAKYLRTRPRLTAIADRQHVVMSGVSRTTKSA